MKTETDLEEADKFPHRVRQVNLTHCQQITNAVPNFNPMPDGKKTCPRLILKFWKFPQLELEYKYEKAGLLFCYISRINAAYISIKLNIPMFLLKFQNLGNSTYLTHIVHFSNWYLLFASLPIALSSSNWHPRQVWPTRTNLHGWTHTLSPESLGCHPKPECNGSHHHCGCSALGPHHNPTWSYS